MHNDGAADSSDAGTSVEPTARVPVATSDMLLDGGLEIQVTAQGSIVAGNMSAAHSNIGMAALCSGLGFDLYRVPENRSFAIGKVYFYLDDP
jgi:hypothetical protein